MKTRRRIKSNPVWLRLKLSYSALRFNPARLWGALETLSRVAMNGAPKDGAPPLTAFPARYPRLSFFRLTQAVIVIDGTTQNAFGTTRLLRLTLKILLKHGDVYKK
jgi:hypothetical protein